MTSAFVELVLTTFAAEITGKGGEKKEGFGFCRVAHLRDEVSDLTQAVDVLRPVVGGQVLQLKVDRIRQDELRTLAELEALDLGC